MIDTPASNDDPYHAILAFPIRRLILSSAQVCELLQVTPGSFRAWVSKGQAPKCDGNIDQRTPYWKLTTILEYLKNAPGGRLPYQVG